MSNWQEQATEWRNVAVDPAVLPSVEDMHWRRLSPRYGKAVLLSNALFFLPLSAVLIIAPWFIPADADLPEGLQFALGLRWLLVPLFVAIVGFSWWRLRFFRYAIREHDLAFRKGMIWRSSSFLPFSRIQHVGLDSGPIDRWLGLRQLTFFTAGSVGADLSIPGLAEDEAERVRQHIIDQAGLEADSE
jgi:hypothetical protein